MVLARRRFASRYENGILASLTADTLAHLAPHLAPVLLKQRQTLIVAGKRSKTHILLKMALRQSSRASKTTTRLKSVLLAMTGW
jgi:hypothetical protein